MSISNTTKGINILRDGDSYEYLAGGSGDYSPMAYHDETEWKDVDGRPVTFTILPSGLVYITGAFQAQAGVLQFNIGFVPEGMIPTRHVTLSITSEPDPFVSGNFFPRTIDINSTDGNVRVLDQGTPTLSDGELISLEGVTYMPRLGGRILSPPI